jgi:hypothetical protein
MQESKDTVFRELLESWEEGWAGVDGEMSTDFRKAERTRLERVKEWEERWDRATP